MSQTLSFARRSRTVDRRTFDAAVRSAIAGPLAAMSNDVARLSAKLTALTPKVLDAVRARQNAVRDADQQQPTSTMASSAGWVHDAQGQRVRPMASSDLNKINAEFWGGA